MPPTPKDYPQFTESRVPAWAGEGEPAMSFRHLVQPTRTDQLNHLTRMCVGFLGVHVLAVGLRLDLFAAADWADEGVEPRELSLWLGLEQRWVEAWCRAAHSHGFLEWCDGHYRLAPHMDTLLLHDEHELFFGGIPQALVQAGWEEIPRWDSLFAGLGEAAGVSAGLGRLWSEMGRPGYHKLIAGILPRLPSLHGILQAGGRLLEPGCGTGYGLACLAQAFGRLHTVGVEPLTELVKQGRALLADRGLDHRVQLRAGTCESMCFAGEFDVVLLKQTLRVIADGKRMPALAACRRALRPGGWLVLIDADYPPPGQETQTLLDQFTSAYQLLELSTGGRMLSFPETRALVSEAGFHSIRRLAVGSDRNLVLVARS